MNRIKVSIAMLAALLTISCGGGTSGGAGGPLVAGPNNHAGTWDIIARIRVVLGGTAGGESAGTVTDLTHTSVVRVKTDGSVAIQSTDSTCAVSMVANGDTLTYQEVCVFAGSNPVSCVLTMQSRATFINNRVSGVFGPESLICAGNATSYSGNLSGNISADN